MAVTGHAGILTAEQRRQADEDGYFLVEGIVTPQECQAFIDRLSDYAHGRRPLPPGLAIQREPRVARGELGAAAGEDVRKISGVAKGDDLFQALVVRPAIAQRMRDLMGPNLELFRADVLMKPAGVGSAKGMHQDSPYWPIEPMALWSCWMPFDPATLENGCMTAIPGSHKRGALGVS
jgi:ectoine hydroxylase-related dioxygenase (phytanoyl-CoA dioxygenase family)